MPIAQKPGCLPKGFTLDSDLNPHEFCIWQRVGHDWFKARMKRLPGVAIHSRQTIRIHPRTYLERRLKGAK